MTGIGRRASARGQGHGPGPRHLRRRRSALRWWSGGAAGLIVALLAVAGAGYVNLQHNIRSADLLQPGQAHVTADPISSSGTVHTGPMNILVLGTDTRAGANAVFGSVDDSGGYGNSDVMIIVHLSGDHRSADVISIPRDTMAPYPGCTDPQTGTVTAAVPAQIINSALQQGGPSCAVKTVEGLTGITFDHFLVADFNAVEDLTNTLGGVQTCVTAPVHDPLSELNLPAGTSTIQGRQALAFLRTRHGFGDGSDLGRIRAQQSFLAAMVRKIKSDGTLTDVPKLYSIADTVTKNLTVDTSLAGIPALLDLAGQLKDIDPQDVTFITVPNEPYVPDPNRVQLQAATATQLFHAVIEDSGIARALAPPPPRAPAPAVPAATLPAAPTQAPAPSSSSPAPAVPAATLPAAPTQAPAPSSSSPAPTPLPVGISGQTANQTTCQNTAAG